MIIRKSAQEIEKMAAAGRVVAETIAHVGEQLEPGVTTGELDRIADEHIRSLGGVPTSLGYRGYPKAICISPNDMVVHGIPGAYEVADGDLITIDVGVTLDGYIADSAFTFPVGDVSEEAQRLLDAGRDALAAGIAQARPGNRVGDISAAVQQHVEGSGLLGRPQPRRPRCRPLLPRGPPHPQLRPARARAAALGGDDDRDRADDHRRPSRGLRPRRRMVDLDRGRLPRRAFRAHRRDHGLRASDPDGKPRPFATMSGRAA
jgi:methionine aminopeptidase